MGPFCSSGQDPGTIKLMKQSGDALPLANADPQKWISFIPGLRFLSEGAWEVIGRKQNVAVVFHPVIVLYFPSG